MAKKKKEPFTIDVFLNRPDNGVKITDGTRTVRVVVFRHRTDITAALLPPIQYRSPTNVCWVDSVDDCLNALNLYAASKNCTVETEAICWLQPAHFDTPATLSYDVFCKAALDFISARNADKKAWGWNGQSGQIVRSKPVYLITDRGEWLMEASDERRSYELRIKDGEIVLFHYCFKFD